MNRYRSRSLRSLSRAVIAMISKTWIPTMPNTAVKMLSTKVFPKELTGVTQPCWRAAAAGLGHVASVIKAGEVLLL